MKFCCKFEVLFCQLISVVVYTGGSSEFVISLIQNQMVRNNVLMKAVDKARQLAEEAIQGGNHQATLADHCSPADLVR